tara:strand:+ start:150 stop:1148 length:999 start_codon:yes stop_codon:yes gene_type:complete
MIVKSFETNKINTENTNKILLYGKNEGFKKEIIESLINKKENIYNYEEKEVLTQKEFFLENIFSKSLFETKKIIIIKRATEKIYSIIKEINEKDIEGITLIINSENLDKKSNLRIFFEKDKNCVCVPFYPDNDQNLSKISFNYLRDKKISLSSSDINIVINKCNGDRENLINELNKIYYFSKSRKKITTEDILKLTNLSENHSIFELIDNCLAKNKKKIISILNENNYTNEDCVLITRTFLNKSKRILKLAEEYKLNKNIDIVLSSAKPPIFWKDKEITKQQIYKWSPNEIKNLIFSLNELELQTKKNMHNAVNLITDFILDQSSYKVNNII